MPDGVIARQHEEVLAKRRNGNVRSLGQKLGDRSQGFARIRGCIVYFKSVACRQNGSFDNFSRCNQIGANSIPIAFGNSKLLADFDLGVVNRKPDNVDLETLGRRFKTFLGRETPKEWGSEICQKFCNSTQTTR
jgi:hypothetical protein